MKMFLLPLAISVLAFSQGWSHDTSKPQQAAVKSHTATKYEKKSIDDIISDSEDSELVKLSGEIIRKLKCSTYLFRDESGEIRIHIDDNDIPQKGLLFNSPITIKGEIEKRDDKPIRVEAERIRYMF